GQAERPEGRRRAGGRALALRAGVGAIAAQGELAAHLLLPAQPGHALRRGHPVLPHGGRSDGRRLFDPRVLAGGDRAVAGSARGDLQGLGRVLLHRVLLLHRDRPRLHVRHGAAVRPEQPAADGVALRDGGQPEAQPAALREAQRPGLPAGQHRGADGRLVPEGNPHRPGPERPQVPHRRAGRARVPAPRRRPAADRGGRHLSLARTRHGGRRGVDRPLRRREARPLQGRALLLLPRMVGRHGDPPPFRQQAEVRGAAGELPQRPADRGGGHHLHHPRALRRAEPAGAAPAGGAERPGAALPAAGAGRLPRRNPEAARGIRPRRPGLRRDLPRDERLQAGRLPVAATLRIHLRQLPDTPAPAV
ncbi:MAG: TRAP transporter solute receptor, unknown substrate 6, partial [uncultured Acetobacteraceae bacterium]